MKNIEKLWSDYRTACIVWEFNPTPENKTNKNVIFEQWLSLYEVA